ncbi:MAG: histidine phosphatase family protein [Halothiobacillaceae bacterium]|nr:histidine phosphatase family protein [Halothiobacillaceae bacterium]
MRHITLLRHGQTSQPGLYHGHNDVSLSFTGRAQMRAALGNMPSGTCQVVSSPLQRCAEIAQDYASTHALPLALDRAWMELDFGAWTGRSADDILRTEAKSLHDFWRDPIQHAPPGGETLHHAAARVQSAWDALPPEGNLLVVTHGGVMRLLFCLLLDLPLTQLWRVDIHYAARMEWVTDTSGTRLHQLHPGHA